MIKTSSLFAAVLVLSTTSQAAPDLDRAMKNPNNCAHPRGQYNNQAYSAHSTYRWNDPATWPTQVVTPNTTTAQPTNQVSTGSQP